MEGRHATAGLAALLADVPDDLLAQAFTHSSWAEGRAQSYDRLAFLGDSVLGLAVASHLFGQFPERDIGELTKVHNQAVSGRACADVARELALQDRLGERVPDDGSGQPLESLVSSERTMASVAEAAIGACFLVHGFDRTAEAVVEAFGPQIEFAERERLDFKSELQEVLARDGAIVSYEVTGESGPPHDRRFQVRAMVGDEEIGSGDGRSKKEAEQAAAEVALERMRS